MNCPEVEVAARTAILLDHGDHASLVVERADGVMVRYSYGDRRWYAEDDIGLASGFSALFLRSDAVISRREMVSGNDLDSVRRAVRFRVDQGHVFAVDATKIDALIMHLEGIFNSNPADVFYSETWQLTFAPHPAPYSVTNNSNHMVAAWLSELGCTTRGNPLTSNWTIQHIGLD